jgi:hypothetical protein
MGEVLHKICFNIYIFISNFKKDEKNLVTIVANLAANFARVITKKHD